MKLHIRYCFQFASDPRFILRSNRLLAYKLILIVYYKLKERQQITLHLLNLEDI